MYIIKILRKIFDYMPAGLRRTIIFVSGRAVIPDFTPIYNEDCLITNHWGAFKTDDRFQQAYNKAVSLGLSVNANIMWRTHVICWAAANGLKLKGAFVECGVNRGFLSRVIIDYLSPQTPPVFYLLDTFKGFDARYLTSNQIEGLKKWHASSGRTEPWQQGMYDDCYDDVIHTFSSFPFVKVIQGAVPETLPEVKEKRIAYLSLDMNCALPEISALNYFWPNMVPGAFVVVDDYGWSGHEEQRIAYDEWAQQNQIPLLSLPTGQALIVKPSH